MNPIDEAFNQELSDFQKERESLYGGGSLPINPTINSTVTGDYLKGPDPGINSSKDYAEGILGKLRSSEQWSDPNSYAKPFSYGAGYRDMNFDRYYSDGGFKKLGFSPFRDNEKVYNENTSFFSDFARAVPQVLKLTGLGFRDMFTEWGDWGGNPDVEHSEEMSKAMSIGNSSRGGVAGWINNFGINLGYTLGITAEMAAEELALTGATILAGGMDAEVTVPMAAAEAAKGTKKIWDVWKGSRSFLSTAETLKKINSVEDAQKVWSAANLGKKAIEFINPLENITEFGKGYEAMKGAGIFKAGKDVTNWALAAKGAVALYRDARLINAVSSESKLEGGQRMIDQSNDLVNEYYKENGKLPDAEGARKIHSLASKAAFWDTMGNIPLIFLTDKIIFDTALSGAKVLKPGTEVAAEEITGGTGKTVVKDLASAAPFKVVSDWSKDALKANFSPGRILKGTLKYAGANLAQGIQENAQDIIQDTLKDYYNQVYKDPTLAVMSASFGRGVLGQLSGQGLDTFLSGFLMGGVIHGVQGPLINAIPQMAKKIFAPTKYQEWVSQRDEYINHFVNTLNDVAKNPRKYESAFNATDRNFTAQSNLTPIEGDIKGHVDAADESAFHSAYWLLKNNHFDHIQGLISDWKKMTPEQLTQAFNQGDGPDMTGKDVTDRLSSFESKVNMVKNLWDEHFRKLQNPVNLDQARQTNNANAIMVHNAFENYREFALFNHYSYQRALDRVSSIFNKASADPVLKKASGSEFSVLYSPLDIKNHLKGLRSEISLLTGDPQSKRDLKTKQNQLQALSEYHDNLLQLQTLLGLRRLSQINNKKATEEAGVSNIPLDTHIADQNRYLYDSYKKYVGIIAKDSQEPVLETTLKDTFQGIKDYYELTQDRLDYAQAINLLNNPTYVSDLISKHIPAAIEEVEQSRPALQKEALYNFFEKAAVNELFNELHKIGVLIPAEEVKEIISEKLPTRLIDQATSQDLDLNSDKGKQAIGIIKTWFIQTGKQAPAEPAPTPEPTGEPVTTKTPLFKMPGELVAKLEEAFQAENKRREADKEPVIATIEKFVKNSPVARDIINKYSTPVHSSQEDPNEMPPEVEDFDPNSILPKYQGKIIYAPSGSGKTTAASKIPGVVDADDLLYDELIHQPGFEDAKREDFNKGYQSPKSWLKFVIKTRKDMENGGLNIEQQIYDRVAEKMKQLKEAGSTVLTASEKLVHTADLVLTTSDKNVLNRKLKGKANEVLSKAISIARSKNIPVETFRGNIEDVLTSQQEEPAPLPVSVQARVDSTRNLEQLDKLEQELLVEIAEKNLDHTAIQRAVLEKRTQLINDVSMENISEGDILVMNDKKFYGKLGLAEVVEKTDDEIKVRKYAPGKSAPTSRRAISADKLKSQVELIYRSGLTEEDVNTPVSEQSEEVARTNDTQTTDLKDRIDEAKDSNLPDIFDKPDIC